MKKSIGGSVENYRYCKICGRELELDRLDCYCRDCRRAYKQEWDANNKEHRLEYQRKWREANPEYGREWKEQWRAENTQDHYIYLLKGARDGNIYAGSTKYKDRAIKHLKGWTHLELNIKDCLELEVEKVQYINVTDYINASDPDTARAEREYLEGLIIGDLEPLLNNAIPEPDIPVDRMDRLRDIYYNYMNDWQEIDIKKITTPTGVATFNYSTLKFDS